MTYFVGTNKNGNSRSYDRETLAQDWAGVTGKVTEVPLVVRPGTEVTHPTYGRGLIVDYLKVSGSITVHFVGRAWAIGVEADELTEVPA